MPRSRKHQPVKWADTAWATKRGVFRMRRAFAGLDDLCLMLGAIGRAGVPIEDALDTYLRPRSRSDMRRLTGEIEDLLYCFPTEPELDWVVRHLFGRLDGVFDPSSTRTEQFASLAERVQQERHTSGHPHSRPSHDAAA